MNPICLNLHFFLRLVLAVACACGTAWAQKPEWAGHGKDKQEQKDEKQERKQDHKADKRERKEIPVGGYFNDQHRTQVRAYYSEHFGHGKGCPPGLAKKHNGCQPPGQAKRYVVGQPLPRDVVVYAVPQPVVVYLTPAPYGYRYVRVGSDILLLSIQTSLVVDVITALLN